MQAGNGALQDRRGEEVEENHTDWSGRCGP